MFELTLDAAIENLDKVISFVDGHLESLGCSMKVQMQLDVAVEELFVNIARYAYAPNVGKATIMLEWDEAEASVAITFIDEGIPFDPLKKADPDVTLSLEERPVGGLGIFMVKKSVDKMEYDHRDGRNILIIRKKIR